MDVVVPAVAGLVGALVGATIAWLLGRADSRLRNTFDLHREFGGEEMSWSRSAAWRLIRLHPNRPYDELSAELPIDETEPLWNVINFYQRLSLNIRYRQIAPRLIPNLFGEIFFEWYIVSFQRQYPDWGSREHIEHLAQWLERRSNPS